jgi:Mn-dependent DtxR family transcriptional regulator
MSRAVTTFEQDYKKIIERAQEHIMSDKEARRLLLLLNKNRLKKLNQRNENEIKKLAQLGIINLYVDNTVTLSNFGKTLIKFIKSLGI